MREFGLPPLVEPLRAGGLADSVFEVAEHSPKLAQLSRRDENDATQWRDVTAAEFRDEVVGLAKGLLANGVRFGDRVALLSRTRYEWTLFSYALWALGAQIVPVYPTSSAEQVRWILTNTRVTAIIVENEDHAMTVGGVCGELPSLRRIWQLDADCVRLLTEQGRAIGAEVVDQYRWAVTPQSPAAIVHTSGTTGRARGCVITHANLVAECDTLITGWGEILAEPGEQPSVLAFLPLAHVYGLMVQVSCMRGGILLGHQPELTPTELLPALTSFRPTFLYGVPYLFEKINNRARRAAEQAGRQKMFDRAAHIAMRYAEALERQSLGTGPGPGPALNLQHSVYDRLVYRRIRDVLGGRARYAVSGGSPLSREIALLFAGVGVTVYDGYGLTETTAAVTGQPKGRLKFGTVGRPLPGVTLRIARDGEILVRGDMVFSGYLGDRTGTEEALRGGWLATGDVGHLDDDGYLVITGRKKDIIITTGGKSVAPLVLEERLRAHPLVSQCLVVGDNRPFIAALITLDPEALQHWHVQLKDRLSSEGDKTLSEELHREIGKAVAAANTVVSRAESIRTFKILPQEFSVDDGLMTPSLKLRRGAIVRMYAAEIDELYAN